MLKYLGELGKLFIIAFVTCLGTLAVTGALGQNRKINEAASKEDLAAVKTEMQTYTDEAVEECKEDAETLIVSMEAIRDEAIKGLAQDIEDIKNGQNRILNYILEHNK